MSIQLSKLLVEQSSLTDVDHKNKGRIHLNIMNAIDTGLENCDDPHARDYLLKLVKHHAEQALLHHDIGGESEGIFGSPGSKIHQLCTESLREKAKNPAYKMPVKFTANTKSNYEVKK
jgi:hypothetical protein